jgi:Tfp pilus assembly protein FimT
MIELLVVLTVAGILAAIAMPRFRVGRMQINVAQRLVIANLRIARANAITRGVHYRVEFISVSQLKLEAMKLVGGAWVIDTSKVQTVPLPAPAQLASAAVGTNVEFNTRGFAVNLTQPQQINVTDTFGVTKSLQAWPSGQVNEL